MKLVEAVSWNFGLETSKSINEHKCTVLKFMKEQRAICVKNLETILGVLYVSKKIIYEVYNYEGFSGATDT